MEKIILKRYELKKDVLALDTKNMAIRIKKGAKYWFNINNNAGKRKVLLYKRTKNIGEITRYLDCIRLNRGDLKKYFKELKDETVELSNENDKTFDDENVSEAVDYIIEEMKKRG